MSSLPVEAIAGDAAGDRLTRRFAFLASAGEVLSSSLDHAETLRHIAQLAVPELGDLCIVDVLEAGRLRRLAVAHVDRAKKAMLEELARLYPVGPGSPAPAARAMASGRTEVLSRVDAAVVASHTVDADHAGLIAAIGMRSHIAVPMHARGAIVGVLSVGITESDREYAPEDVLLAEQLARLAGLAVDNARLYLEAQREIELRRRTESELHLSSQRYRAILEQSPLSTQILAPDGRTLAVNAAWERLWGLSLDDLRGYSVLRDPQLDAQGITPLLRRAFAGERVSLPLIPYDPDSSLPDRSRNAEPLRWISAFAYPVLDGAGTVREVVLVHQDTTELRQAAGRLEASQARLRRALDAGHMTAWDWDLATGLVECSDNALEFWGRRLGRADDFLQVVHPDDLPRLQAATAASAADGAAWTLEYRLRTPDGGLRWVHTRADVERDAGGRPARMLGVTLDITDLHRAEDATRLLAQAGAVLGTSLDYQTTLGDLAGVVVPQLADWYTVDLLDEAGGLQRVSVRHADPDRVALAYRLFERYPPRADAGRGALHVIATGTPEWMEDIPDALIEQAAHDAEHLTLLRSLQLRSYIVVPLQARGTTIGALTLVYAESGRRYGRRDVDLALDLARRAAAAVDNARLHHALQLEDRRKTEFLATLAHELRNPLAPIRNALALLQAGPDPAAADHAHAVMERQLGHMVRLVDDLLDLSRVTRGAIELLRQPVGLATVVAGAVEASGPLVEAAGLSLRVVLPDEAVSLDADPTRLTQVLTNLLNNAARFTERGGRVELAARIEEGDVRIEVSDTGIGIPADQLDRVFEMFSRNTDPRFHGGLGIGLTLSRRLVELHGGRVWAESAGPGHGSRFTVRLPRLAEPAARPETAVPMGGGATRPRRILVVDDNRDAAETLADVLALHGHEARVAHSADAALAIAPGFLPEAAFLDIGLPGMDGHELARRLRSLPGMRDATLVAVTGWGRSEDRAQSQAAGFDHHLTKPAAVADVLAVLAPPRAS